MGTRDPRVDAYIARSADFAKPILTCIREVVHDACPQVEETMKWSMPHFDYKGMLCGMGAFKEHCALGFWKASLVLGAPDRGSDAMGHFGRITKLSDLPPQKTLREYIQKAMALNESGIKAPRRTKPARRPIRAPAYFTAALRKNKKALATFEAFSPSHRREYLEWVTEAKTEATRKRRLAQTVQWLAQGKPRHWKHVGRRKGAGRHFRAPILD